MPNAAAVIARPDLAPHPEGGYFRETFGDPRAGVAGRSHSTAICILLAAGELSDWHRIDATVAWTLIGCTVAPGFDFATFELAPPDWPPMPRQRDHGQPRLSATVSIAP